MIAVDTNILAYRFIPGPRNEDARLLAEREPLWAAPLLWRSELRNVLTGYLRRQTFSPSHAEEIMSGAAKSLLGREHAVENALVFGLALRSGCTSYDCEFVALALTLQVPLVTEDSALLRDFPDSCLSLAQALAV
jgi:predicted nucleic acid-binding protein